MDITTEVGTHILVSANLHSVGEAVNRVQHESENLSGLHNQIVSHQPMTTLQILRIAASHSPPDWQVSGFQVPSPPLPSTNARHTNPSARNGSPSDGREVCRMQGRG